MRATLFTLTSTETQRQLGAAVLAPEAQYASVAASGQPGFLRRQLTPDQWADVQRELSAGFNPWPLPHAGAIAQSLTADLHWGPLAVQYLWVAEREMEQEEQPLIWLDRILREAADEDTPR